MDAMRQLIPYPPNSSRRSGRKLYFTIHFNFNVYSETNLNFLSVSFVTVDQLKEQLQTGPDFLIVL